MEEKKKISQRVAASISADIASGRYFPGDRLPSERELAQAYGVSRIALREATAALESQGIIEIRHGAGIWVLEPLGDSTPIPDSEGGVLELLEARRILESEVAALAAHLATADDVAELERLVISMKNPDYQQAEEADRAFHHKLADITRNGALISLVEHLWNWRYQLQSLQSLRAQEAEFGHQDRSAQHTAILAAISNHSPAGARKAMQIHMDEVQEVVLSAFEAKAMESLRQQQFKQRKTTATLLRAASLNEGSCEDR